MPDATQNPLPLARTAGSIGTETHGLPPPESPDSLLQTVARRSSGRLRMRSYTGLSRGTAALLAFGQMHCDRCGTTAWPAELEPGPDLIEIMCKECISTAN